MTGFASDKVRVLLYYLAATGRPHSRDALAELLWADMPATSRSNLRKALSNLRNIDGIPLLEEGQRLVALDLDRCWVDVGEFARLADDEAAHGIDNLTRAVRLYQDDFLAGFNTSLSHEFESWAAGERERLRAQMVAVLGRLAELQECRDAVPEAVATVRRMVELEPWREDAHRRLMALLASGGDSGAALVHFDALRVQLKHELDAEPSTATLELVASIRTGEFRLGNSLTASPPSQPAVRSVVQEQPVTTVEFPLTGRDRDWKSLREIWQRLHEPHFVSIGGEAGIGKTRLAGELLMLAEAQGVAVARTRSHALQGQLAYGPVTDWLRTMTLQSALSRLDDAWLTEIAYLLPEILVERPGLPAPEPLRESWQRKRLFDALAHAFAAVDGPLLLVLDDLQWTDVDTLEWLQYLVESAADKLLVLGTVRVDELGADHRLHQVRQQLIRHDRWTEIRLGPLSASAARKLAALASGADSGDEMAGQILQETAGNPLFVVESARATQANLLPVTALPGTDAHDRGQAFMPQKVYEVLRTRLSTLTPEARAVAEVGAAIGRAFDVTLLASAAAMDQRSALLALDELWQRRIVREVGAGRFDFSHDRIRDVAYHEIGAVRRRLLHRDVAVGLEAIHGDDLDRVVGEVALHYTAAGMWEQATDFHRRAADGAQRLYAHREAVRHRRQALDALRQLPGSDVNRRREIDLLIQLGDDLSNADGLGIPSAHEPYQAAHELAQELGTARQRVNAALKLQGYARVRGEWLNTHNFSVMAFEAALDVDDPALLASAHLAIAEPLLRRGNCRGSLAHFEQGESHLAESSTARNLGHYTRYAYCLWLVGHPDQALERVAEALRLRREFEPSALPIPLHHYSSIALFCGDVATVDRLSAELVEVATERQDDFSLRWGLIYRGWLQVHQGDIAGGIAVMREHADEHRARENYFYECVWRSLLAEAYIMASDFDAALEEIDSTLAWAEKSGDVHWNAQLLKLRGDCLQAGDAAEEEVERHYQCAVETAREQQSRSLELRAATNLARLWQKQGRTAEAQEMLAAIYSWFSEGFETADLVEASSLLDELASTLDSRDSESVSIAATSRTTARGSPR